MGKTDTKIYQKFKRIDDSNRLQDDDVLFVLHKHEVRFLVRNLKWLLETYPHMSTKSKRIIHDILNCIK